MITRQLGVEDIAYYGDRLSVFEEWNQSINPIDKGKKRWYIAQYRVKGLYAERIQEHYVGNEKQLVVTERVSLKELYPKIKHVNDFDGVLIARRNAPNRPLMITGKGMGKFIQMN